MRFTHRREGSYDVFEAASQCKTANATIESRESPNAVASRICLLGSEPERFVASLDTCGPPWEDSPCTTQLVLSTEHLGSLALPLQRLQSEGPGWSKCHQQWEGLHVCFCNAVPAADGQPLWHQVRHGICHYRLKRPPQRLEGHEFMQKFAFHELTYLLFILLILFVCFCYRTVFLL